jgi:hypothetical protein
VPIFIPARSSSEEAEFMPVRHWHHGKIIILWSWGGFAAALLMTHFMGSPVNVSPISHLTEFVAVFLILVFLSLVTWNWLSGKETK